MARRTLVLFCLICTASLAIPLIAGGQGGNRYKSTFIDQERKLHIVLASRRDVLAPMEKYQVGFEDPLVSPDGKTVGWLELYPSPDSDAHYDPGPISGPLILYRNGHILHRLTTEQVIWDWHFWRRNDIAYSVGPTHGGAVEILLRNVTSGHVIARWRPTKGDPPVWAKGLRY